MDGLFRFLLRCCSRLNKLACTWRAEGCIPYLPFPRWGFLGLPGVLVDFCEELSLEP